MSSHILKMFFLLYFEKYGHFCEQIINKISGDYFWLGSKAQQLNV